MVQDLAQRTVRIYAVYIYVYIFVTVNKLDHNLFLNRSGIIIMLLFFDR